MDWFQIGKYIKAVYCHPAYLDFYVEYIMQSSRLGDSQHGINIGRININKQERSFTSEDYIYYS